MRKLIFILLIIPFGLQAQNSKPTVGQVFNTISDMKQQAGGDNSLVYVLGGTAVSDFRGAFYIWDGSSTLPDDVTYYNVVSVTGVSTGRWIRTNQSSQSVPQGTLFRIGPLKILAGSGVTNSGGEFQFNLTTDGTQTGASIFSSILFNSAFANQTSAAPNDAVMSAIKTPASGTANKYIVFRFTKGNVLGVLGALSISAAGSNVPVQCFVVGI